MTSTIRPYLCRIRTDGWHAHRDAETEADKRNPWRAGSLEAEAWELGWEDAGPIPTDDDED